MMMKIPKGGLRYQIYPLSIDNLHSLAVECYGFAPLCGGQVFKN